MPQLQTYSSIGVLHTFILAYCPGRDPVCRDVRVEGLNGPSQSDVVVFGCTLGSARIQQLKARVLLVAGVGVLEIALEQMESGNVVFSI